MSQIHLRMMPDMMPSKFSRGLVARSIRCLLIKLVETLTRGGVKPADSGRRVIITD